MPPVPGFVFLSAAPCARNFSHGYGAGLISKTIPYIGQHIRNLLVAQVAMRSHGVGIGLPVYLNIFVKTI